jgi:hypothetical protein
LVLVAAAFLAAVFAFSSAEASTFDPASDWRTISTPHFRVHFPERIRDAALKSADILEEIYPKVTALWSWKPWSYTEVVLTDSTDMPNGLASVLPYNWMLIYITPPDPDSSLGHYDDWLRMLLVHEYTHIVQIDAIGGAWWPARFLLGKTVSPSGMNPAWMREGIAQFDETYFTKGGRGRGSFSEMMIRTSVLEDAFPAIDQADGQGWKWPGYKSSYVYGLEFVEWLINTYGWEKFEKLDKGIRSSLLLGMLNHRARNVYDRTFYELWREWQQVLVDKYEAQRVQIEAAGLTAPRDILVPTGWDGEYKAPTLSPDGKRLVYTATSPHRKAEIRLLDLETGETEVLKKGHDAVQFGFSLDGTKLVYAAPGRTKRFYYYYDVYLYNFDGSEKKHRVKRLTTGARARDPDFDRSGQSVVFITLDGSTEKLERIDIESKERTVLTQAVDAYTQFANPRVSPDGRFIAVSVWKPDLGWRIWKYTSDGAPVARLTKGEGLAIESRPVWTPDGQRVIFSSDESGIANLSSVAWDGGDRKRLTNVLSGVYQPTVSRSFDLIAQYYTSKGFVIARFDYAPVAANDIGWKLGRTEDAPHAADMPPNVWSEIAPASTDAVAQVRPTPVTGQRRGNKFSRSRDVAAEGLKAEAGAIPTGTVTGERYAERKYTPFSHSLFLPRFVLPAVAYENDAIFASATTGGSDILRWHNWLAGVTYRTDANYVGYYGRYWYNRYRTVFGVSARQYAVDFGDIVFVDAQGQLIRRIHYYERRRGASAFVAVPIEKHSFSLSYFYEDHAPITGLTPGERQVLNLGAFAGFRGEYHYGDAEEFPASISKENGRNIRLMGSMTNKYFGSADRNEQIVFAGDWREYVRLYKHHVLALRAAGGMTWGDDVVQGTFGVGGAVGEGALASGGSFTYYPLRGLPVSALSGTRAMLFSAEYRFPIWDTLRGLGTAPLFVKGISGAIFADYGNAWNSGLPIEDTFDDFLLGVGAELRGDFIVGHGLPLHARIGYAIIVVNRDRIRFLNDPLLGSPLKYGMLVLALGWSF